MQGEQLMICTDGLVRTKVENAIKRRAFARMIKAREEIGKDNLHPCDWSAPEKVMAWWLQGQTKEE